VIAFVCSSFDRVFYTKNWRNLMGLKSRKAAKIPATKTRKIQATKSHIVVPGSRRPADRDAVRVGPIDPNSAFDVTLILNGPKLPGPDEQVNLTPQDLLSKYGATQAEADAVTKSLNRYGLKVDSVSLETRSMKVSGPAKAMRAAFKADLSIVRSPDQGEYRGRRGTYSIPTQLKGIVKAVIGLDERKMARRKAARKRITAATSGLSPVTPADLEQRYNFPPGDCAGQKVAIAEFGGGYFVADAEAYCAKFRRPLPNIVAVSVEAPAYTLQQILALPKKQRAEQLDNSIEVMMDVEVIAGLCPGAEISVYFSPFDQGGWVDLLNAVIAAKPVVFSVSWGLAEDDPDWAGNAVAAINDRLNMLRLLGVTTCVSAGDDGSGDQIDDGKAHVDFPGSSPFVLAVGGTMLTASNGNVAETTWWESPGRRTNSGGGSTGGGVSTMFQRPNWQTVRVQSLNSGSIDGRVVPDVAALAGEPLYDLVFLGKDSPNGGTSASAPLWAALIARINAGLPSPKQQRFLTPLLYGPGPSNQPIGKLESQDITSGNNASFPQPGKGYKAGPGFDAVTGWGVPNGAKLLSLL
jgi:kumamolisin